MEHHCENAFKVAEYLQNHHKVSWVNYAALPSSKYNEVAKRKTKGQASGVVSFGINGGA